MTGTTKSVAYTSCELRLFASEETSLCIQFFRWRSHFTCTPWVVVEEASYFFSGGGVLLTTLVLFLYAVNNLPHTLADRWERVFKYYY